MYNIIKTRILKDINDTAIKTESKGGGKILYVYNKNNYLFLREHI